jgi:hypothetical protein
MSLNADQSILVIALRVTGVGSLYRSAYASGFVLELVSPDVDLHIEKATGGVREGATVSGDLLDPPPALLFLGASSTGSDLGLPTGSM